MHTLQFCFFKHHERAEKIYSVKSQENVIILWRRDWRDVWVGALWAAGSGAFSLNMVVMTCGYSLCENLPRFLCNFLMYIRIKLWFCWSMVKNRLKKFKSSPGDMWNQAWETHVVPDYWPLQRWRTGLINFTYWPVPFSIWLVHRDRREVRPEMRNTESSHRGPHCSRVKELEELGVRDCL